MTNCFNIHYSIVGNPQLDRIGDVKASYKEFDRHREALRNKSKMSGQNNCWNRSSSFSSCINTNRHYHCWKWLLKVFRMEPIILQQSVHQKVEADGRRRSKNQSLVNAHKAKTDRSQCFPFFFNYGSFYTEEASTQQESVAEKRQQLIILQSFQFYPFSIHNLLQKVLWKKTGSNCQLYHDPVSKRTRNWRELKTSQFRFHLFREWREQYAFVMEQISRLGGSVEFFLCKLDTCSYMYRCTHSSAYEYCLSLSSTQTR